VVFQIPDLGPFDHNVCEKILWNGETVTATAELLMDGRVLVEKDFSAADYLQLCYGVEDVVDLCVGLDHIDINPSNHTIGGCADVKATALGITLYSTDIDCFSFKVPDKKNRVNK